MTTPTRAPARKRAPARPKVVGHQADEQPELIEDDAPEQTVNGIAVVNSVTPENLPGVQMGYTKLTLADDTVCFTCIDCDEFVSDNRDAVRRHRKLVHVQVTKRSANLPEVVQTMTIAQLLNAAQAGLSAGVLLERVEAERDQYRLDLTEMTKKYTSLTRALERAGFAPKLEDE